MKKIRRNKTMTSSGYA